MLAKSAIDGNSEQSEVVAEAQNTNQDKLTIKQMIVEVLGLMPEGAEALTILQHINSRFKASLERTSLSPQLSRLKNEGVIERNGLVWSLNEEGPAEPAGPFLDFGGGTGREAGYPPARPEGSIPSASTPFHRNGSLLHGDRSAEATTS